MRAPDLQKLVNTFGGVDQIPPEMWAKYDAAIREWRNEHRDKVREEQFRNQGGAKPQPRRKKAAIR